MTTLHWNLSSSLCEDSSKDFKIGGKNFRKTLNKDYI